MESRQGFLRMKYGLSFGTQSLALCQWRMEGKTSTARKSSLLIASSHMFQFFLTLRDNLDYLDDKHTSLPHCRSHCRSVFGEVAEGLDILDKINTCFVDEKNRPLRNIRIRHTVVLDDPFDDPPLLAIPPSSPPPPETVWLITPILIV